MNLAEHMVSEGADVETELCKGGVARVAPSPSGSKEKHDPER